MYRGFLFLGPRSEASFCGLEAQRTKMRAVRASKNSVARRSLAHITVQKVVPTVAKRVVQPREQTKTRKQLVAATFKQSAI